MNITLVTGNFTVLLCKPRGKSTEGVTRPDRRNSLPETVPDVDGRISGLKTVHERKEKGAKPVLYSLVGILKNSDRSRFYKKNFPLWTTVNITYYLYSIIPFFFFFFFCIYKFIYDRFYIGNLN